MSGILLLLLAQPDGHRIRMYTHLRPIRTETDRWQFKRERTGSLSTGRIEWYGCAIHTRDLPRNRHADLDTLITAAGPERRSADDHRVCLILDAALGEQLFHISVTEWKPVGEPDGVADDLRWEAMPVKVAGTIRHGDVG